ncbi:hypothetical protein N7509_009757 [Penicillium cosmopolitanum]|uniref:Uncharacterized protein n=1 Tax=Penicillium cosmopolitanum TaxID=1131564 RepID=A0A9X0B3Z3_9EURO|nr:uncharacterized protein N7509_009757 [Penicillium cosmopolitanum]KAJ5387216.1 hypothetical protein N7509_009757 [Penicillium cosmopolitanum]
MAGRDFWTSLRSWIAETFAFLQSSDWGWRNLNFKSLASFDFQRKELERSGPIPDRHKPQAVELKNEKKNLIRSNDGVTAGRPRNSEQGPGPKKKLLARLGWWSSAGMDSVDAHILPTL